MSTDKFASKLRLRVSSFYYHRAILGSMVFLLCGSLDALPLGNPAAAMLYTNGLLTGESVDPCTACFTYSEVVRLRIGYYGEYVFNRNMRVYKNRKDGDKIGKTQIFTNGFLVNYNLMDWIDLFGTVGTTHIELNTMTDPFSQLNVGSEVDFESNFSWGLGSRAQLFQYKNFGLGIEGGYFATYPRLSSFLSYETGITSYLPPELKTYREWQVGVVGSYIIQNAYFAMVPYFGVDRSWAHLYTGGASFHASGTHFFLEPSKSSRKWGFGTGITFISHHMVGVTVETRWKDEKAMSITGEFRF